MASMHHTASVLHEGRRDEHGHLWTRESELFCWRCDSCGRRLHGVKAIWLDYECPVENQSSCTDRESEPSIHLHDLVGSDSWEQWAEDGEPMTISSLHERLCRLERQRVEVLQLQADLERAEARIARLENEWWLRRVDRGVWHSTTLESWKQIEKEKAITVRDDGPFSKGWQHDNDYVCVWDFRDEENFDRGWASLGKSHIRAHTTPGTVWIEIDVEATATGDYLSPRDYGIKIRAGEPGIVRVIPGCEGGVKHQVPESHWKRVEMITKDREWKTLRRA